MKCPSCQFEQPDDRLDCECCGLVFSKWKKRNELKPSSETPADSSVPAENPEDTSVPTELLTGGLDRFYHRLAAVNFQMESSGEVVYFPWGSLGPGYGGMNPETRGLIARLESQFACVHCPALVFFWTVALIVWLRDPDGDYRGLALFLAYLAGSYSWFWWRAGRWTAQLKPWPHPYDQKQYMKNFKRVFEWNSFLNWEVGSLALFLTMSSLWLSGKFLSWFENGQVFLWILLLLSFLPLAVSSFYFYFRRDRT